MPRKSVNLRLDPELWERIKEQAARENRTATNWLETVAREALRRRERDVEHYCEICSANGQETPATRYALGKYLCDECAREYDVLLRPGERLEDMTREEMDLRIYSE